MSNEWLFLTSALFDITFVFLAARRGTEWLYASIATNLILVSILGAKLISVFGLVTNVSNVFYACVFLATHFILEREGKRSKGRVIWFGAAFIIIFAILSQAAARFTGLPLSAEANNAILTLFPFSLHIAVASILAYVFAQEVNIFLYEYFRARAKGKRLWLRSNVANVLSQLVDSLLFFSLAFFDLPGPILLQSIVGGWLFKSVIVLLGTPFLYADASLGHTQP